MVVCLAVGSQGGYKPKCRTIYETAYTTQYEQSCSTSYKTECSTSYQQHCSTEYQTEYEQKVKHIFILLKNDFFTFFQVLHQLRGAMLHQLRDFLRGEVFNHLQRGLLIKKKRIKCFKCLSRFVHLAMVDTVDMASSVRRFPPRAVSKSQFRSR